MELYFSIGSFILSSLFLFFLSFLSLLDLLQHMIVSKIPILLGSYKMRARFGPSPSRLRILLIL